MQQESLDSACLTLEVHRIHRLPGPNGDLKVAKMCRSEEPIFAALQYMDFIQCETKRTVAVLKIAQNFT